MGMYTLLYLKWITNKNLLYSTWNSSQCSFATWMGGVVWGRKKKKQHENDKVKYFSY